MEIRAAESSGQEFVVEKSREMGRWLEGCRVQRTLFFIRTESSQHPK